jgi:glycerol-3-phosphate acyltransferase PlsX
MSERDEGRFGLDPAPTAQSVTVAVDALGGDFAPTAVLDGVSQAIARDEHLTVILTGPASIVEPFAAGDDARGQVIAVATSEVIAMDEHPATAVRTKKDSSLVVAARQVKEGAADAFFSAGSTGACLAAGILVVGRIKGVKRPALAVILPGVRPVVLIDNGANADCKPAYLEQFAHMGAAYAQVVLGVAEPSVALLNIGAEEGKGSTLTNEAFELLKSTPGFIGNIEGGDLLAGKADVVVTDGFTGNVVLKSLEGAFGFLLGKVKGALTATNFGKLGALAQKPSLKAMQSELNPDRYGAAPLLGVEGLVLVGHGSSSPEAIANGISVGAQAVRGKIKERLKETLERGDK